MISMAAIAISPCQILTPQETSLDLSIEDPGIFFSVSSSLSGYILKALGKVRGSFIIDILFVNFPGAYFI